MCTGIIRWATSVLSARTCGISSLPRLRGSGLWGVFFLPLLRGRFSVGMPGLGGLLGTAANPDPSGHLIVNNTRFLLFPWVRIPHLASKVLSLASRRLPSDWQERYGYAPVLLETFVDPAHYRGTCYQAANWIAVGVTQGRGRQDRQMQYLSTPKRIYVYPLVKDFRTHLCGSVSACPDSNVGGVTA
jgi:hypothetical protein